MAVRRDSKLVGRVADRLRSAFPWAGRRLGRGPRAAVAVPVWMVRGYRAANASDLAAAVAFNALVALVPTLLLVFAVAGLLLRDEDVLLEAIHAAVRLFTPQGAHQAIDAALTARRYGGWAGAASLIGFAWIGTGFVGCLARSMNRVYGAPDRSFGHQRARDFALILGFAGFFLPAVGAATAPTLFVGRRPNAFFETWGIASGRYQAAGYGVSLLAAVALFLVLYRVVPNAGQRVPDVWPGALAAAVLFVGLAQAFPLYFRVFGTVGGYGTAFGFVSLLVGWFYFFAHVLLFGAYVNATHQRRRAGGKGGDGGRPAPAADGGAEP